MNRTDVWTLALVTVACLVEGKYNTYDRPTLGIGREYQKNRALPLLEKAGVLRRAKYHQMRRWYIDYYLTDKFLATLREAINPKRGMLFYSSCPSWEAFKIAHIESWTEEDLNEYIEKLKEWWRYLKRVEGKKMETAGGTSVKERILAEYERIQREGIKPTTRNIAKRLGVSQTTVVRALQNARETYKPSCPHCHSTANVQRWSSKETKAGFRRRYRCTACGKTFLDRPAPNWLVAGPGPSAPTGVDNTHDPRQGNFSV